MPEGKRKMSRKVSSIKATDLRTEYMKDPLGIDIVHPRLSWKDEGLIRQAAYEIEFDIEGKKSSTGKIVSSCMHHMVEEELHSRDHVIWKVRIYDENGNVSGCSEAFCWNRQILPENGYRGITESTGKYAIRQTASAKCSMRGKSSRRVSTHRHWDCMRLKSTEKE